jgi:hypothetical protein
VRCHVVGPAGSIHRSGPLYAGFLAAVKWFIVPGYAHYFGKKGPYHAHYYPDYCLAGLPAADGGARNFFR